MAKLTKLEQNAVNMLPEIVAATAVEPGFVYKSAFDVAYLIENNLVEQNEALARDTDNGVEFATRATETGAAFAAANCVETFVCTVPNDATVPTETPASAVTQAVTPKPKGNVKMTFEIEKGIEMPKTTRGGKRESAYPFDALEVGDSFFIPVSEKHPEPWKSLASTISGATKRHDVLVPGETKQVRNPKTQEVKTVPATKHVIVYQLRGPFTKTVDGVEVKGARVFRTL